MIGRAVGNYRVVSLLGEGGMGAVYLAEHPRIERKVAVKVLRGALAQDPVTVARFLNEARAASAIRHRGIIEILDSGTLEPEGAPYIIMELLEGEGLDARLRRLGRLGVADAVQVARETASALVAAHAKGVVHRDLKPANLFLVREEGGERVKVLDFGIAKLHAAFAGGAHTQTGSLMGTPFYMSPEQCRNAKQADHRSDIYALGVILYEMLCGAPPFVAEGFGEIISMHLLTDPEPPSARNPEIPRELEQVILRALAKKPDERYASAAELAAALGLTPSRSGLDVALAATTPGELSATDQAAARSARLAETAPVEPAPAPSTRVVNPSLMNVPPRVAPAPAPQPQKDAARADAKVTPARAAAANVPPTSPAAPTKKRGWRLAVALLVLLVGAGAGAYAYVGGILKDKEEAAQARVEEARSFLVSKGFSAGNFTLEAHTHKWLLSGDRMAESCVRFENPSSGANEVQPRNGSVCRLNDENSIITSGGVIWTAEPHAQELPAKHEEAPAPVAPPPPPAAQPAPPPPAAEPVRKRASKKTTEAPARRVIGKFTPAPGLIDPPAAPPPPAPAPAARPSREQTVAEMAEVNREMGQLVADTKTALGLRDLRAGKYDEAEHEFQQAYSRVPDPVLLYYIGECNRLAGRPVRAAEAYQDYLQKNPNAANRAEIGVKLEALMQEIARRRAAAPP
jgi:serine/threonine protein kinase